MDAGESVREKRMVVRRVQVRRAHGHEQREREELDDHHDVIGRRALPRAAQQQPCDQHDDAERRHVNQDRHTRDMRRGRKQPMHLRIGAEKRGAVAGRHPHGQLQAETAQQRIEIVAPRNRDRDVADRVLENQVPADDPRNELAKRRVRVRIGAPRLRNHGGQFRVAQTRQRACGAEQQERKHERGSGAGPNHFTVWSDLTRRRSADRAEDPGADHRADREHDQIARAERPPESLRPFGFGHQLRDRLAREELRHWGRIVTRGDTERTEDTERTKPRRH